MESGWPRNRSSIPSSPSHLLLAHLLHKEIRLQENVTDISVYVINAWFFGIYSFFHENAEIWGNVISYYVLKETDNGTKIIVPDETLLQCGVNFCGRSPDIANPNLKPPSEEKRYILTDDSSCEDNVKNDKEKPRLSANLLIATFEHMKNRDQLLLIPLSFYCGLADGFYNCDFTKSYIACAWGISQVGHVTICYGVVSAVMDCSSGSLVKWLTRIPVFLLAGLRAPHNVHHPAAVATPVRQLRPLLSFFQECME
ncbi:UNC93-like protein like [Argiope bruennichi]|uniref:UNC93-like protein like n=1 Tax=Argiope bruennichi TaxID=94029 RepID=A0A8T0FRX5_ARGBR|nr:UNC93-like protein like [Argiope bruennichi]